MAAAQDGYASSGRIPISPSARGNWMRQQQVLEEQDRARNQAYLNNNNRNEPVPAPHFGGNPPPAAADGLPPIGVDSGGDEGAEPPVDLEAPPRPYEEEARYRGPAGEQFLNPLPSIPSPYQPGQGQPAQAGLPIPYR